MIKHLKLVNTNSKINNERKYHKTKMKDTKWYQKTLQVIEILKNKTVLLCFLFFFLLLSMVFFNIFLKFIPLDFSILW